MGIIYLSPQVNESDCRVENYSFLRLKKKGRVLLATAPNLLGMFNKTALPSIVVICINGLITKPARPHSRAEF